MCGATSRLRFSRTILATTKPWKERLRRRNEYFAGPNRPSQPVPAGFENLPTPADLEASDLTTTPENDVPDTHYVLHSTTRPGGYYYADKTTKATSSLHPNSRMTAAEHSRSS